MHCRPPQSKVPGADFFLDNPKFSATWHIVARQIKFYWSVSDLLFPVHVLGINIFTLLHRAHLHSE